MIHSTAHTDPRILKVAERRGILLTPSKYLAHHEKHSSWRVSDIDFELDRKQWQSQLNSAQRKVLSLLISGFCDGEGTGASILSSLVDLRKRQGRQVDADVLVLLQKDEGKHTAVFDRFLRIVACQERGDRPTATPSYTEFFDKLLPARFAKLVDNPKPIDIYKALLAYHLIAEGAMASSVISGVLKCVSQVGRDLFPGMREMLRLVRIDESRHLAMGLYAISLEALEHKISVVSGIKDVLSLGPVLHGAFLEPFKENAPFPFEENGRKILLGAGCRVFGWLFRAHHLKSQDIDLLTKQLTCGSE